MEALHELEQHWPSVVHGTPGLKQQVQGLVPAEWHCCCGLGQRPPQVAPVSWHGVSLHMHMVPVHRQVCRVGQSPPHTGGLPFWSPHTLVVVVVLVVAVVVVVPWRIFSTGTQSIFGLLRVTFSV